MNMMVVNFNLYGYFSAYKSVRIICFVIFLFFLCSCGTKSSNENETDYIQNPVDLVNPFIDTHDSRWFYFSSASRPLGMVNLSPDTDTESTWHSGYLYDSDHIRCFSHVHGWQLAGIPVMPISGEMKGHMGMDEYQSAFSHEGEIAKPGYHKRFSSINVKIIGCFFNFITK